MYIYLSIKLSNFHGCYYKNLLNISAKCNTQCQGIYNVPAHKVKMSIWPLTIVLQEESEWTSRQSEWTITQTEWTLTQTMQTEWTLRQ